MLYIDEEIVCACGERFTAALSRSLNPQENPEVREIVACGEVNVVRCPACGAVFYAEGFVLYHDPDRELIAFVHPAAHRVRAAELRVHMNEQITLSSGLPGEEEIDYPALLLFGMEELAVLLRADEEALDESAVLAAVAPDLGLDVVRLKQGAARLRGLMPCLPALWAPGRTLEAAVREGLRVLLEHHPSLARCAASRALLREDSILLNELLTKKNVRTGVFSNNSAQ